jgi:hypothetical protein|tara:strand:- start:6877 stop:7305 length:429 start_codon:yes stop_codon:yes gene_type:complete
MGTTTFSGPIKAGTIREGGSQNTGFVEMAQSAAWSQSASAASTGIIIPANSQITEITLYITTAPDSANLSVGTSASANELFSALALGTSANVIKQGSTGTITDADTWADVGSSDVTIQTISSTGSSGAGYITVKYIQNNNLA